MDNFTEGTDFTQINIPDGFTRSSFTGAKVTPSGAGRQFDYRIEARFYRALAQGVHATLAEANLVDKFFMSPRHTAGSGAVFERYYMIVYFGTNSHMSFTDADGNQQSYCKGIVAPRMDTVWVNRTQNFLLKINWASVWS